MPNAEVVCHATREVEVNPVTHSGFSICRDGPTMDMLFFDEHSEASRNQIETTAVTP